MIFSKLLSTFFLLTILAASNAKRIGEASSENVDENRELQYINVGWPNFFHTGLSICFSSYATADVQGRGPVSMDQIRVGDNVLTGKGRYEPVYAMAHRHPTKSAEFVQIYSSEEAPLELTERHMLFVEGNEVPVPAHSVKVGDQVRTVNGSREVIKIAKVTRDGIFNPLTPSGTIAVNGVVTSVYSALTSDNEWVEIAGNKVMTHESFFHKLLKPYRLMCTGVSMELCKSNSEFTGFVKFGVYVLSHWVQQGEITQAVLGSFYVFLACIWDVLFSSYALMVTAVASISLVVSKQKKKIA